MKKMTAERATLILACPMNPDTNDAGAFTVRGYMVELARTVWCDGECFSGKRPFGDSGWENEVYDALVRAELVPGTINEEGDLEYDSDRNAEAHALVASALAFL